jgi:hypothetical protein
MLIHIGVEELEENFRSHWRANLISHPHIDYATNAIHGSFENEDCIIFRFKDYGFIHDNRGNSYNISSGTAGIIIQIIKNN